MNKDDREEFLKMKGNYQTMLSMVFEQQTWISEHMKVSGKHSAGFVILYCLVGFLYAVGAASIGVALAQVF